MSRGVSLAAVVLLTVFGLLFLLMIGAAISNYSDCDDRGGVPVRTAFGVECVKLDRLP